MLGQLQIDSYSAASFQLRAAEVSAGNTPARGGLLAADDLFLRSGVLFTIVGVGLHAGRQIPWGLDAGAPPDVVLVGPG